MFPLFGQTVGYIVESQLDSQHAIVTGGAGFIGSRLVEALIDRGVRVTVLDDLSTGFRENLKQSMGKPGFRFIEVNLSDPNYQRVEIEPADLLFHFAADPEVRRAEGDPAGYAAGHFKMNQQVADIATRSGVSELIFASSAAIYGEASILPTPIDYEHPKPVSVYGTVKLEFERLLGRLCSKGNLRGLIVRYANIIGPRGRHGIVYDLLRRVKTETYELEVLGDGTQKRSFLYIDDCISSTLTALTSHLSSSDPYIAFNVGNLDTIQISEAARIVAEVAGKPTLNLVYKPGTLDGKGWKGDLKQIHLDVKELVQLGWKPNYNSREAVRLAAQTLSVEFNRNYPLE